MTNELMSTFNVGDTTRAVHNKNWARQIGLATLSTIFSVFYKGKEARC